MTNIYYNTIQLQLYYKVSSIINLNKINSEDSKSNITEELNNNNGIIEGIIKEYNPKLKRYISYLLPYTEKEVMNDILQDIMMKIVQNKNKIISLLDKSNFNLNAYLYRIARNYVIDFLRKEKQNNIFYVTTNTNEFKIESLQKEKIEYKNYLHNPNNQISPEDNFIQNETLSCLEHHINRLKLPYREILFLYYYEKLPLEVIAQKLNLQYGATSMRLQRARYRLKKILENACCIINNYNNISLLCDTQDNIKNNTEKN